MITYTSILLKKDKMIYLILDKSFYLFIFINFYIMKYFYTTSTTLRSVFILQTAI